MAKINVYQRELYHHGILGQKWGRRNGPPYPLDASDHSAAEKKAGYKKSLGGGRNENLYNKPKLKSQSRSHTYDEHGFATEKEYEDWVKAGRPKRDVTVNVKQDYHEYTSKKSSDKNRKEIDEMGKKEDYQTAIDKFDSIGSEALIKYKKEGKDAVTDFLASELGDREYTFMISDETYSRKNAEIEKYVMYSLKLIGDDYVYSTVGEEDYSDDSYFYKRK